MASHLSAWITQHLAHGHILSEPTCCRLWHAFCPGTSAELADATTLLAGVACRPHYSGTTLDAQARYSAGTKEILRRTFDNEPLNETDVIVQVPLSEGC